jgi:hypothetical protein
VWLAFQIVLLFTAPLRVCDLGDLVRVPHGTTPDAAAMPLTTESESQLGSFLSPIASSTLRVSSVVIDGPRHVMSGPRMTGVDLPLSPQVQPTVLRL